MLRLNTIDNLIQNLPTHNFSLPLKTRLRPCFSVVLCRILKTASRQSSQPCLYGSPIRITPYDILSKRNKKPTIKRTYQSSERSVKVKINIPPRKRGAQQLERQTEKPSDPFFSRCDSISQVQRTVL